MKKPLEGRVAIVTGASRGIGRAIAKELAKDGAACLGVARDAALLENLAEEIGCGASSYAADLRDVSIPEAVVRAAVERYGRIDILVNNAGATKRGDFLALSETDWQDGFALKFFGAVRLCRAAWPHLKEAKGSVVHIAGSGGRTPGAQFAIGGSVNAAMLSLTKALAELGVSDGVQVNAINPGAVRTDRFRTRLAMLAEKEGVDLRGAEALFLQGERIAGIGEPEDVAALVAFIVGPRGRFLHGSLIDMDGGATKTI